VNYEGIFKRNLIDKIMIEELLTKYDVQMDTINRVIAKTNLDEEAELDKLRACRSFIRGFIDDLNRLKYSENKIS